MAWGRRLTRWVSATGIAVILGLLLTTQADAGVSYSDANAAYKDGKWDVAVTQYEALVAAGIIHPHLYYNLGNAYFRCATEAAPIECPGGLGHAVYYYERALRLDPVFLEARDNLNLARETVATKWADRLKNAESDPLWIRLVTFLTVGQLSVMFLIFNLLFFGGLVVNRFLATGFTRTALTVTNVFSGVAFFVATILLAGHIWFLELVDLGIVLPNQVQMREGADEKSAERAEIHAGLRVKILGRERGWVRIELANGHEGWVPDAAIGEL
jgi:hypothetical protein